jgi:hypothetical protein
MNWGEIYLDHYERFLGKPIDRSVFSQGKQSSGIQILQYANVFDGCATFASLGLTHYAVELKRVAEVVLAIDDGWNDAASILANTLFYLVQNRMELGWGISIAGVDRTDPAFADAYGKTAIYFARPQQYPREFASVPNGGSMYAAFPISASEHRYFCENGALGFEEKLVGTDVFDVDRASVI